MSEADQIKKLEKELAEAEGRIIELENDVASANTDADVADDRASELEDDLAAKDDVLRTIRMMLARNQTDEAIDYCDRHLPARLRYAR